MTVKAGDVPSCVIDLTSGCPTVERDTPLGRVRGFSRGGADTFLAIPYGRFAGRFLPVDAAQGWEGTRDATKYAPYCPQQVHPSVDPIRLRGEADEECFYVNVHIPEGATIGADLPVLVWIHGGGFGGGSANAFDGSALAVAANAVVVTLNYRLGLLGWLDVSDLGPEYRRSGDCWLMDQVAALEWVHSNVTAFGGDPGLVTIMGTSAGAASVLALYQVPEARGLFHRAVACSPPHFPHEPRSDLATMIAKKRRTTPAQARTWALRATVDELVALGFGDLSTMASTGPVYAVPTGQGIGKREGGVPPLIVGFTSHEGDFFTSRLSSWWMRGPVGAVVLGVMSRSMLVACADGRASVTGYAKRLRRAYGSSRRARVDRLFVDFFRRSSISCALAVTDAGSRAYLYELDVPCVIDGIATRSTHSAEQELTFHAVTDPDAWVMPRLLHFDERSDLTRAWANVLGQFIRTGEPGDGLGPWAPYDGHTRLSILITPTGSKPQRDRDGWHRRSVWGDDD